MWRLDIKSLNARIGMSIMYCELLSCAILSSYSLYLFCTKNKRTIGNILLMNLCSSELLNAIWESINFSLHLYWNRESESALHYIVKSVFWCSMYQSVILITLDRILAVKLTCRYKFIVTKRKVFAVLFITWLISSCFGPLTWYLPSKFYWLFWHALGTITIIGGYSYIIRTTLQRRKTLHDELSSNINVLNIKYEVPLSIAVTYLTFVVVPIIILLIDDSLYSIWIVVLWDMNLVADPLVYVIFVKFRKKTRDTSSRTAFCSPTTPQIKMHTLSNSLN